MSEAADPEREIEDLFNAEIFGVDTSEGAAPPGEAPALAEPPESKPLAEVVVDAPEETPEGTPEEPIEAPDSPETPPEQEEVEVPEGAPEGSEDEYVNWARKQYGEDLDLDNPQVALVAKAAYEKEKMLGRKAEESRRLQQEAEQREIQQRIDALNTPGNLTDEEEQWVNEAITTDDPGEYAYNALQAERPDLYAAVMDRWGSLGETEARRARVLHTQILQLVTQPQPSEQETYALALGQTFTSLGLNIETHGAAILQKAEQLGSDHPAVQGMMSADDDVRRISTRAIYDLVTTSNATVARVRQDDVVSARVQEEQLRQQAAGVNTGGPRVATPPRSAFWDQFDEELAERGWDGNSPSYGRE